MVETTIEEDFPERPTVLLTGGSGFVGRNVSPILERNCNLLIPTRAELDLLDEEALEHYIKEHAVDVLVHSANPNPVKNPKDDGDKEMFSASIRSFMNVFRLRHLCPRVLYLGSGAEFDKRRDLREIKEEEVASSVPIDAYGEGKFVMNALAHNSDNVTNLRLFACYGPYDFDSKFITHCIRSVLLGRDITIRQDCRFDYLHVYDLAKIIDYFIHNEPQYRDYNIASGSSALLSEIAQSVLDIMGSDLGIVLLSQGLNKEYTASIERLESETGLPAHFMSLREGIELQVEFEKETMSEWIERY